MFQNILVPDVFAARVRKCLNNLFDDTGWYDASVIFPQAAPYQGNNSPVCQVSVLPANV